MIKPTVEQNMKAINLIGYKVAFNTIRNGESCLDVQEKGKCPREFTLSNKADMFDFVKALGEKYGLEPNAAYSPEGFFIGWYFYRREDKEWSTIFKTYEEAALAALDSLEVEG